MKKAFLLVALLSILAGKVHSQTTLLASLAGYPIVTTGWVLAGSATTVDSEIELIPGGGASSGEVYYNLPLNVTACGSFTVDYDYKIVASTAVCLGDGIAFFFTNPLTGFATGGSLGLPATITGVVFTMDTYDNDGDGNNPEHELKGYTTATAYAEGPVAGGSLCPLVAHVTMADGNWHHIHITYNGGTIRVYLNYSTTAAMTGTYPINTAGYFGFSAGTGACVSTQYVKAVYINANTSSPILGVTTMCEGSASQLSDSTSGGTWSSSNTTVATVGSTGLVFGANIGTSVITYSYNSGACVATTTVNIVAPIGNITGPTHLCAGTTITLVDATTGGTWSSSTTTIASVGSTGIITTGATAGTTTITYSTGGTCFATAVVTVNTVPTAITGTPVACTGLTTALGDGVGGGTWTSSNTAIATIGTSGTVSGIAPGGTSTITYSLGSVCFVSTVVTVNLTPYPVSGTASVCAGNSITLSDPTGPGTWSSSSGSIATVGSTSGVVTGANIFITNTSLITYTAPDGCTASTTVTVNPDATAISGTLSVCAGGQTTELFEGAIGTWSSSNTLVATVGSAATSTVVVTGVATTGSTSSTVTITFSLPTGCSASTLFTVNPLTTAILPLNPFVCIGGTVGLSDATAGGFWTSNNSVIAIVDPISGIVTGEAAGVDTIVYNEGCNAYIAVTVDPAPPIITGPNLVCPDSTIALSDAAAGGTWSSSSTAIATIGSSSGIVEGIATSGGGVIITYTAPTGCATTSFITVYGATPAFTAGAHVCVGQSVSLSDPTPGGTWTSNNNTIASVTTPGGVVTGGSAGTDIITYTLSTGCGVTGVVTVNPSPGPVLGTRSVCVGSTTNLSDGTSGGTWTSGSATIAIVGSATGIVTGIGTGAATTTTTTVTYSTGGTCGSTAVITVNALPVSVTVGGGGSYCSGTTEPAISISGSTVGVLYTLDSAGIAVSSLSGTGSGFSFGDHGAGIYTVTAENVATGCSRTMTTSATITAIPPPAAFVVTETNGGVYCSGSTVYPSIGLSGSATGVTYKLYNGTALESTEPGTGIALTFGSFPGVGTYTVTATSGTCISPMTGSAVITIAALPGLETVTGGGSLCPGSAGVHVGLGASVTGVNYVLEIGGVATTDTVAGTGGVLDFGLQAVAGTYTVLAINASGCTRTMTGSVPVAVSAAPVIGGAMAVCENAVTTLTVTPTTVAGGTWSSSTTTVATIGSTSGTLYGESILGTSTITYTSPGGCIATEVITVSPGPGAIGGASSVCVYATDTETDLVGGGTWTCVPTTIATISPGGVVTGVHTGTATITYSLGTGCTVTKIITVMATPAAIGGSDVVCYGSSGLLTDATSGGAWSSSNGSIATVGGTGTTGTVYSVDTGVTVISYALGSCSATTTVTVVPAPGPIVAAVSSVCVGSTILLTDIIGGGTWTSSAVLTASVDISGNVYGIHSGTSTITYSLGGACVSAKEITVNPISAITGGLGLCVGSTTTLSDATTGGSWQSANTAVATITGTGLTGGAATGTAEITYTTGAGCTAMAEVTVNTIPSLITGLEHICVENCAPLYDSVGGGVWTSSNVSVASVNSTSGLVCGSAIAGTSTIIYSLGYGCTKSVVVTVNGTPSAIGGTLHACEGSATTLTEGVTGTWSSSNTSVATVSGSTVATATETVWGVDTGTSTIIFTPSTGCPATTVVTINPVPGGILGTLSVCEASTTSLSDATSGGTWSSSNTSVATVTGTSGIVHGVTAGISTISYTAGGCSVTSLVTVLPPPPAITGGPAVCAGQSVTLSDANTGGTWSVGSTPLAEINALSGVFTGISSGTVIVSYSTGSGCTVITSIIINAVSPISGDSVVCQGQSVMLSDTTAGGSWTSSNSAVATTYSGGLTTGVVTGAGAGTATITYELPTGCQSSYTVSVNPGPGAISGPGSMCNGSTITLSDVVTGGVWSSSSTVVTILGSSTGVVAGTYASGGTATITYSLAGTGCPATTVVTVYPVPAPIEGSSIVCVSTTLSLRDDVPGGAWGSTNPAVATVDATTGVVSGIAPGTTTISYLFGSCSASLVVTVSAPPAAITGVLTVCSGSTITLSDITPGGSWSSSETGIAAVDGSGDVTGGDTSGTVQITYTTGAGCSVPATVTVNPLPNSIGQSLCQGTVTTLTDLPPGGTWSSNNSLVLSVDTLSGSATAVSAGTATLTYTSPAGCSITGNYTVNPSTGALSGATAVCLGFSTTLSDTTFGGSWSSSNTLVAMVDGSGDVYGAGTGTATITYGTGSCPATITVTVNSAPGAIGPGTVCTGSAILLGDTPAGGMWGSSDTTIATVGLYSGVVTGQNQSSISQVAYITYSLGVGCTAYTTVTVNPLPGGIYGTGTAALCDIAGNPGSLFDVTGGGTWSSSNGLISFSTPLAGAYTVTGVGAGTSTVSYTLNTGCATTAVVTVNVQPNSISGSTLICLNGTQTLGDDPSGGSWSSSDPGIASVITPGAGIIRGLDTGVATITYQLGDGCLSHTLVTVDPLPYAFAVTVTGSDSFCAGGAGVEIGLSGSGDGVNYLLYLGATATGTVPGTGSAVSFGLQAAAGTYTAIGTSTSTGCSNSMTGSATVTITPTVAPSVSVSTGIGDTVCAGTSATFTPAAIYGGGTPAYQWYVNDTEVSTSGTYTYVPANGDEVSVTLTSDYHCVLPATASTTVRMTVWTQQLPVAGIAIRPGDTVCQGTEVRISAEPIYGGLSPAYTWVKNGTPVTSGAAYAYVPDNGDSVYVRMASDYPCRLADTVNSNVLVIAVDTQALPMVTISASPGTSVAIGEFDTLTASVENGGMSPHYQWVVNEIPVSGATTNTYVSNNFQYPNEDSVTCLVTSSGACSATSYGWVYISLHPEGVTTQAMGGEISILPNPNKGSFTIKGTLGSGADQQVSIELTDMLGQSVYKETIQAPGGRLNEQINLSSSVANGMYLLNLRSGGNSQVFHMVIEQ